MSFADLCREAFRSLEANKGRSLLTILGIVIGIAAVIAMTSLIGGVRNGLISGMGLNAARIVHISCGEPLSEEDVEDLARLIPDYEPSKARAAAMPRFAWATKRSTAASPAPTPHFSR